jgi:hypothetical protein
MEKIICMKVNFATFLERGVAPLLDELQEVCGVNVIRMQTGMHAPNSPWDPDAKFPCGGTGAPIQIARYAASGVQPSCILGEEDDATRLRLWEEIRNETRDRKMILLARTHGLGHVREARGISNLLVVDPWGRVNNYGCYNNPQFQAYGRALVEDAMSDGWFDGIQIRDETKSTLRQVFGERNNAGPNCFCVHCQRVARERGIDVERAREGYKLLVETRDACKRTGQPPRDGGLVFLMRTFTKYPEIWQWHQMMLDAREGLHRALAGLARTQHEGAIIGHHTFNPTTFEPFFRSEFDYQSLSEYIDWVMPMMYHKDSFKRQRKTAEQMREGFFPDLEPAEFLEGFRRMIGWPADFQPPFDHDGSVGMTDDFLTHEINRAKANVTGETKVVAGLGWDIGRKPDQPTFEPSFERTYQATAAACAADPDGVMLARAFRESHPENLKAAGRAMREAGWF